MSFDSEWGPDIVETTDEAGNVYIFEKIREVEFEGNTYALLRYPQGDQPTNGSTPPAEPTDNGINSLQAIGSDDDEEEDRILLMRLSYDATGAEIYDMIEDEDEFERLSAHIAEKEGLDDDEDEVGFASDDDDDDDIDADDDDDDTSDSDDDDDARTE